MLCPVTAFVLALGAFFAGLLKVGFGQGSGILALPLCTLVVSARFANGVLAPLLALSDLFSIRTYWRQWETRLLLIFLPGQTIGVVLGAYALAHLDEGATRRIIGVLLLVTVGVQLWARRQPETHATRSNTGKILPGALLASFVAGVSSALAQLGSGFLTVYLVRLRTAKSALVPTLNLTFFFTNLVKIVLYWRYGLITGATWAADAWLAPVVLLGGTIGVAANRRLSQRAFENAVLGFALLAGAKLLVW